MDPAFSQSPGWSCYKVLNNNPVWMIDPQGDREYSSAENFERLHKGKTWAKDKGKGDWLLGDRLHNTETWKAANEYNLHQQKGYEKYSNITQRTAFYGWFQKATEAKGFRTQWAGAAYIIAQQMSLMDDPLIASMTPKPVITFANQGNKAIFDDVFDNLSELYFGPIMTGADALSWDVRTLTHEQRDVIQPLYEAQSMETLKFLSSLAKGEGFRAFLGYSFDRRFPVGGPLYFSGNIMKWSDRFQHGMTKAVPFYRRYGSIFNWNIRGDGRIDTVMDPDNPGRIRPGEHVE